MRVPSPGSGTSAESRTDLPRGLRAGGPWVAFAFLSIWGYLLYGIGSATPYLRDDLRLTAFEAGLHASGLAIGSLVAGLAASTIANRMGVDRMLDISVALVALGVLLVVTAPVLPISLAAVFLMGLGGGSMATHLNVMLGKPGGAQSRKLMSQANAWSMIMAAAAPVAIGLSASVLHAWRIALVAAIAAIVALTVVRPRATGSPVSPRLPRSRLPGRYWAFWLLMVLGVSVEFSFVYWGSTMVGQRTGLIAADATLLASLFVAGMVIGRISLGRGLGAGLDPRILLAGGLGVAVVGALIVGVGTTPALAGLGLLLGGLGTAGVWPFAIAAALQSAPHAQIEASAGATLGAGLAVLIAPSALGLLADGFGVVTAWGVIPVLAALAFTVAVMSPRTT
jgi:fucose permease